MRKGIEEGKSRNKNLGGEKKKKMKTKLLAFVEIAIVLCSVFLVTIPAIAAEQNQITQEVTASSITTASEDDYVLGIYGNANEDDTIDMRDLTYVKLIFFGKKPETELADAKYDGKINPLDFIQIKLIIVGKEKELTIVDANGEDVTVKKPVERIIVFEVAHPETLRSIKAADKIIGVDETTKDFDVFFPELSKLPSVGRLYASPDIEKILELQPDLVLMYAIDYPHVEEIQTELEPIGIKVVRFDCCDPETYVEEVDKLGYILDRRNEAKEFIDFYQGCLDTIRGRVEGLSDEDKPRVYFEVYSTYFTCGVGCIWHHEIVMAGGKNIFGELTSWQEVDPEAIIMQDPEIILRDEYYTANGYNTDDTSEIEAVREEIMSRPELQDVTAVKNKKVYIISTDINGGSAQFITMAYMAKWFHPTLFEDLDPQALHQEYLTRFQHLDYDLDKHGVFVYPGPS